MEGIEACTAKLVGTSIEKIVGHTTLLINNKEEYDKMSKAVNPYGSGDSTMQIKKIIKEQLITKPKLH